VDWTYPPDESTTPRSADTKGFLVSLDGPSGVGKTTTARHLSHLLTAAGHDVACEAQPSRSPIGELARHGTHTIHGLALTCLMAADRYDHLTNTLIPHLAAGRIAVCDRYTPTAFVLDQLDGVDPEFIVSLYRYARPADLHVFLKAPAEVCADRARARGTNYSRFHHTDTAAADRERALFSQTAQRYRRAGLPVLEHSTDQLAPGAVASRLVDRVLAAITARQVERGRAA
jgi:dTMP kinase